MLASETTLNGRLAFIGLLLCAFGLAFSISVAQTGLGITFILFIVTLFSKNGRRTLSLAGAGRLKLLYAVMVGWVIWRIFHVLIAARPLAELIEAREVWLMLIPVFIWLYANDRKRLRQLVLFFLAGVAASSAWGAWQMRADFLNMVRGRGLSTMHHLNFAGIAALASVMGLGLFWNTYYSGKKWRSLLVLLLTLIAMTGLWLTKSRAAIAVTLLLLPVFLYLQLFSRAQRIIFVLLILAAGAAVLPRIPDNIAEQYRFPPPEVHAGSQAERRDLWQAGYAMIRDNFWIGYGERGYNEAYPRYQVQGATGVAEWDAKSREASHMHNDFINTWVLYGAIGLLLQLGYYFLGFGFYLRERFHIRLESDRPLAAAGATAILLMALMGITQCHFTSEIVQMGFWLCVGVLFTVLDTDRAGTQPST